MTEARPEITLRKLNNQNPEEYGLPAYPSGVVVGPCVCGGWPGGPCLRCPVIPPRKRKGAVR